MDGKQTLGLMSQKLSVVTVFPMMCLRCEDILVLSLSVEFDAWRM